VSTPALASRGVSPAGYIDEPTRQNLERLAKRHRDAEEELHAALQAAVESGISLRSLSKATGIPHTTIGHIARRRRDAQR
jgi:hypothetical protein